MQVIHQLKRRGALLAATAGVAAIAGAAATAAKIASASPNPSGAATASAPEPSPSKSPAWAAAQVFRDASTSNSFTIQLQEGRPDTGRFDYFVAGRGDYIGTAALSADGSSGNVDITGSMSALLIAATGSTPGHAEVRLQGHVLKDQGALTLEIWIDGAHTNFATGNAGAAAAGVVAQKAVAALGTHDWATFYGLLAPEIQNQFGSEDAFARAVAGPNDQVIGASPMGSPTLSSGGGYSYFSQDVDVTLSTATGPAASKTTICLVYENGAWLLLGTDPVSPA